MKQFFLIIISGLLFANIANAADLIVNIYGIKNNRGTVRVGLWNDGTGFPTKGNPAVGKVIKARSGDARVVFKGVQPGVYAISLFHDQNSNERLDTNLVGIPTEGYGFSNNLKASFGPPSFRQAGFRMPNKRSKASIQMIYR